MDGLVKGFGGLLLEIDARGVAGRTVVMDSASDDEEEMEMPPPVVVMEYGFCHCCVCTSTLLIVESIKLP